MVPKQIHIRTYSRNNVITKTNWLWDDKIATYLVIGETVIRVLL